MTQPWLTDDEVTQARDALTLRLAGDESPFALTPEEKSYSPEQWAWLFLSLNKRYRDAYERRMQRGDLQASPDLAMLNIRGVAIDDDGQCAGEFGLAAWISPSTAELPELATAADSWFFPLKRVLFEAVASNSLKNSPLRRQNNICQITTANVFGYRLRGWSPPSPSAHSTTPIVWAAIDCSIPPDAQIDTLFSVAKLIRENLRRHGWKTHRSVQSVAVEAISQDYVFADIAFQKPEQQAIGHSADSTLWRAVCIDSLAPLGLQRDLVLSSLRDVHEEAATANAVRKPMFGRLKNSLVGPGESQLPVRQGSFVKALAVLAELDDRGIQHLTPQILGLRSRSGRYSADWKRNFDQNIDRYIEMARWMTVEGYRFLIHAQQSR